MDGRTRQSTRQDVRAHGRNRSVRSGSTRQRCRPPAETLMRVALIRKACLKVRAIATRTRTLESWVKGSWHGNSEKTLRCQGPPPLLQPAPLTTRSFFLPTLFPLSLASLFFVSAPAFQCFCFCARHRHPRRIYQISRSCSIEGRKSGS